MKNRRSYRLCRPKTVIFAAIITLTACATAPSNPAFPGLTNRGVVPVSADSPSVGANLFLAGEMERSTHLYNFIHSKGAPQALEARGENEISSELLLFYAKSREYYSATPHTDPITKTNEWIIRGPYPINREHHSLIHRLDPDQGAVLEVFGRREVFGRANSALDTRIIAPAFVPTPKPKNRPQLRRGRTHDKGAATVGDKAPQNGPAVSVQGTPINLDQEALLESKLNKLSEKKDAQ